MQIFFVLVVMGGGMKIVATALSLEEGIHCEKTDFLT